jgi:hypothetical protein
LINQVEQTLLGPHSLLVGNYILGKVVRAAEPLQPQPLNATTVICEIAVCLAQMVFHFAQR